MIGSMEFAEVVRRRRMVRNYAPDPVDNETLDRILANALHAPSAGFSQGWAFLVLDTRADVDRFWSATTSSDPEVESGWLRGMRTAPCIVVPLACKDAYLDRYAEPDKGWTDRAEERWPIPYWYTDTAMAALLMLLTATDEGLGACFFGIPGALHDRFRAEFGVPAAYTPVGAVTIGHRTANTGPRGSADRGRRTDVIHRGRWAG
jgi:nitroreductase